MIVLSFLKYNTSSNEVTYIDVSYQLDLDVSQNDPSGLGLISIVPNVSGGETLVYTPPDISGVYQLQLDVSQNPASGTGSLTLVDNPSGGTLNRLVYTPPSGSSLSDYGIFTLAGTYTHDLRTTGNTVINTLSQVLVSGGVTLLNSSQIQLATVGTYEINYMFDVQQISGTGVFGMALILAPTTGQFHFNGQWWTIWTTYTGSWVITTTTANTIVSFQTSPFYHPQNIRIAGGASQNQISVFKMV